VIADVCTDVDYNRIRREYRSDIFEKLLFVEAIKKDEAIDVLMWLEFERNPKRGPILKWLSLPLIPAQPTRSKDRPPKQPGNGIAQPPKKRGVCGTWTGRKLTMTRHEYSSAGKPQ
jgi:hypothetical protein